MLIRFVGDDPGVTERTVQTRDYDVRVSQSSRQKVIRILDAENSPDFVLGEGEGEYHRAYLMNDAGDTIETILAPSIAAFQVADSNTPQEGEA